MNSAWLVFMVGVAIGLLHLRGDSPTAEAGTAPAPAWPAEFEGLPLTALPSTDTEKAFTETFPGAIAQFQWGDGQVILRQVTRPTRKLHSSATCLKAAGFSVSPGGADMHHDPAWASYEASRSGTHLRVREQIRSVSNPDATWTDVSSWFWEATFHPDKGPWIAVTILEQVPSVATHKP